MLFYCLFQCFEEKEYQMESKQNETFGRVIFGTEATQATCSRRQGSFKEAMRQGGTPCPLGHAPHPRGPLVAPLTDFFHLYILIYLKTSGRTIDREFRRQKHPQPPKTNLDPFRHPAGGGNPSLAAIFIILALSMTRREQFILGVEGMYQQLCV